MAKECDIVRRDYCRRHRVSDPPGFRRASRSDRSAASVHGGAAFCALFAFPFFWLLNVENITLAWLAPVLGLAIGHSAMWGPQASCFSEAFETRVRYSGTSFVYQFSGLIASAPIPAIATTLLYWAGGSPWPLAVFIIAFAVISFISTYMASETFQSDISKVQDQRRLATT